MNRRPDQRRVAVLGAAVLAVATLTSIGPATVPAGAVATAPVPVAAAAPVVRVAVPSAAQATSRTVHAAVAPYRVGTRSYARWWARRLMATEHGWTSTRQYRCLVKLWQRESGWSVSAYNAGSGATGIPQAVPGSKMRSAGRDWRTNAVTQVRWGLTYIDQVYGSPCGAWAHSQARGWY